MEADILSLFKRFRYLQLTDLAQLYKIISIREYEAGELLAREGEMYRYILGVRKGILRTYVLTADGEEKTVNLTEEGRFTSCGRCMLKQEPSCEFIMTLEKTKVIRVDAQHLKRLGTDNIRLLRLWTDGIEEALYEAVTRIQYMTTLSPERRYLYLLEHHPELIHRVPQKYLASYIGITTVSLSRIRNRLINRD